MQQKRKKHEVTVSDLRKIKKFTNLSEEKALNMLEDIKALCHLIAGIVLKEKQQINLNYEKF